MSGFTVSFKLGSGLDLGHVKRSLAEQINDGPNSGFGLTGIAAHDAVNNYLQWINGLERTLKNTFVDQNVWTRLREDTYWHIRDLNDSSPRWQEVIYHECQRQSSYLEALLDEIQAVSDQLGAGNGQLAVIDTNVLLEHVPPEQIKWGEVVGKSPVRLVIPLRVLDELDEKKYTAREDKADRARRLLGQLWTLLGSVGATPVKLTDEATVEVPISAGPRRRTIDADQEVIDTCESIRRVGGSVVLVTADYGMCIRASALGIEVKRMPEKYLRRSRRATDDVGTQSIVE
ncbi:MAG: PIN domain-containing protein [Acidimicrobiales bacterium]